MDEAVATFQAITAQPNEVCRSYIEMAGGIGAAAYSSVNHHPHLHGNGMIWLRSRSRIDAVPMNEPVDVPTNTVNRGETESSTKPSTHSPSHPSNETKTLALVNLANLRHESNLQHPPTPKQSACWMI